MTNTEAIGPRAVYEVYLFLPAAGLVLLVAMIGAIVLTLRHKEGVKRQNISDAGGAHTRDGDRNP